MTTQNIFDLSDTWNAGGTTYTAIKMDVTDTASAAASLLLDLQVGSASKLAVAKDGSIKSAGGTAAVMALGHKDNVGSGLYFSTAQFNISLNTNAVLSVEDSANGVRLHSSRTLGWSSSGNANSSGPDLMLRRAAAATLAMGAADAASPVAQTLKVQGVVAGTTDTAGANFTLKGSQGTGAGAGGSLIFQVAPAGGSGSAQNALANSLVIDSTHLAAFTGPVKTLSTTVAALPAAATAGAGARAFVTDANATTFMSTVAGGGANAVPVVSDGTNWKIG